MSDQDNGTPEDAYAYNPRMGALKKVAELEEKVKRLECELAKREWRPISTAPKDGLIMLGCRDAVRIGEWNRRAGAAGDWESLEGHDFCYKFTHWMPMVEGPTVKDSLPVGVEKAEEDDLLTVKLVFKDGKMVVNPPGLIERLRREGYGGARAEQDLPREDLVPPKFIMLSEGWMGKEGR